MATVNMFIQSAMTRHKSVEFLKTDTIETVINKIHAAIGIPKNDNYYVYRNSYLLEEDSQETVEEKGFKEYESITVNVRVRSKDGCPVCGPQNREKRKAQMLRRKKREQKKLAIKKRDKLPRKVKKQSDECRLIVTVFFSVSLLIFYILKNFMKKQFR